MTQTYSLRHWDTVASLLNLEYNHPSIGRTYGLFHFPGTTVTIVIDHVIK
jgi:hypothetical protein